MTVKTAWQPNPGSQQLLLSCPVREILLEGNRGGGKTEAVIADFLVGVGQGWGKNYRGITFRNEYKHLGDIITKCEMLIPRVFPKAKFKSSAQELKWIFPEGEELLFRHAKTLKDYKAYHGHSYVWQNFGELTNFPDLEFYDSMGSCLRSPIPDIRKRRIGDTNPFGIGHNAVKARFIDPAPANTIIKDSFGTRVRIHSSFVENPYIFKNDPEYIDYLKSIKDENVRKAWLLGDWNIVAGGAFDDLWDVSKHVYDADKIIIPRHWKKYRSFDWGSSAPFSVGWWAVSPGESIMWGSGEKYMPKGTLFRIGEWYGAKKAELNTGLRLLNTEIAQGIKDYEKSHKWDVKPGAADSAIWSDAHGEGKSIYDSFHAAGVKFVKAVKGPGSRKMRMSLLRDRLGASLIDNMEVAGIFISSNCREFIRQIPLLPRDDKDYEVVDTSAEDHLYDEATYQILNYETNGAMFTP